MMDENTALNDTTNATTKDQEWKKKGYTSLVVSLALLLVVAFYAGQSRGARTSHAGSGGTASLMMLSNEAKTGATEQADDVGNVSSVPAMGGVVPAMGGGVPAMGGCRTIGSSPTVFTYTPICW